MELPGARVRIVLVRSRNSLNMGAAARAMANFGLDDLVLVQPFDTAWQEARSARAGAGILQRARVAGSVAEAVADCECVIGTMDGSRRTPVLPLENWPEVAATLPSGRVALLFGSEKTGLSVEDASFCQRLARIPTRPDAPSMNLGQAVAICAYELFRGPADVPAGTPQARQQERDLLVGAWYPLLEQTGVVPPGVPSQHRALRQMLARWRLSPGDAHRLLGLARQLRHALAGRLTGVR